MPIAQTALAEMKAVPTKAQETQFVKEKENAIRDLEDAYTNELKELNDLRGEAAAVWHGINGEVLTQLAEKSAALKAALDAGKAKLEACTNTGALDATLRSSQAALAAVLQDFTVSVDSGVADKWDGSSKAQPSGSGTAASPYKLGTAAQLAWFAATVNSGSRSACAVLTADIDLNGQEWTPIANSGGNNGYTGTFDGGGHTIMGLTVTTNDQYVGLFGRLGEAGTVKNVVMDGIQITCNHRLGYAGGVAGFSWGGTIENCSVSGSVSGTICAGGVVGIQWEASITGCSSSATVKGMVQVGGVAGETNAGATMAACYATGNVTIEIDPIDNIRGGGLVGFNAGSSVLACYATGNVTSTGSSAGKVYIGGLLGGNYTTVTACYWKNNYEQGIGYNKVSIAPEATKVDGSVVTWQKAVDAMNRALQNAGSEWRYELKGALPTLRKQ